MLALKNLPLSDAVTKKRIMHKRYVRLKLITSLEELEELSHDLVYEDYGEATLDICYLIDEMKLDERDLLHDST